MYIVPRNERKSHRHTVRLACQVVRQHDFKLLGSRTLDLSAEGMLIPLTQVANVGEAVIVSFQVPRSERWIDAEGVVTRIVRGRRPTDIAPACGVRLAVSPRDRLALKASLLHAPSTRPAREVRPDYAATVKAISVGR